MNELFNVVVDSEVIDVRERAKAGDFNSMVLLGSYILNGSYTRQNTELALTILDHVLAQKDEIPLPETLWNALTQRGHIHALRGEYQQAEDAFIEIIREITKQPLEKWHCDILIKLMEWLWARQEDKNAEIEQ